MTLFFGEKIIHDIYSSAPQRREIRPFAQAVEEYRANGKALLVPAPENFWRLGETATLLARLAGKEISSDRPYFQPTRPGSLRGEFQGYVQSVNSHAKSAGLEIGTPSFQLEKLLNAADKASAVSPEKERDFFRILGAHACTAFTGPSILHLDLSRRCQAGCVYCWYHSPEAPPPSGPTPTERDLKPEHLKNMLMEAQSCGVEETLILGEGDPLCHPEAEKILSIASLGGPALSIFTNGMGLNDAVIHSLIKGRLKEVYISLSAASEPIWLSLHAGGKKGDFPRIIKNIRELKRSTSSETRVTMLFVICRENMLEMESFAQLANNAGATGIRFQMIHPGQQNFNRDRIPVSGEEQEFIFRTFEELKIKAARKELPEVYGNLDFQIREVDEKGAWSREYFHQRGCSLGTWFAYWRRRSHWSFCCAGRPVSENKSLLESWFSKAYDLARLAGKIPRGPGDNIKLMDGQPLWTSACDVCENYDHLLRMDHLSREFGMPLFKS